MSAHLLSGLNSREAHIELGLEKAKHARVGQAIKGSNSPRMAGSLTTCRLPWFSHYHFLFGFTWEKKQVQNACRLPADLGAAESH